MPSAFGEIYHENCGESKYCVIAEETTAGATRVVPAAGPTAGSGSGGGGAATGAPWYRVPAAVDVCFPIACVLPPAGPAPPAPPTEVATGPSMADLAEAAFVQVTLTVPSITIVPGALGYTQTPTTITIAALTTLLDSDPYGTGLLQLRATPVATWVAPGDAATYDEVPAVHTYRRTGCHTIRVRVTWQGSWSTDGATWTPIGTRTTQAERDYPVAQITGVLVDPDAPPPPHDPRRMGGEICAPGQPRHATPWPAG